MSNSFLELLEGCNQKKYELLSLLTDLIVGNIELVHVGKDHLTDSSEKRSIESWLNYHLEKESVKTIMSMIDRKEYQKCHKDEI